MHADQPRHFQLLQPASKHALDQRQVLCTLQGYAPVRQNYEDFYTRRMYYRIHVSLLSAHLLVLRLLVVLKLIASSGS